MSSSERKEGGSQSDESVVSRANSAARRLRQAEANQRVIGELGAVAGKAAEENSQVSEAEAEEIEDNDIRFRNACDVAAGLLRKAEEDRLKPGYEDYKTSLELSLVLKNYVTLLIAIFIFLSRPEWCSALGSQVDYSCSKSLDPSYPVTYIRSGLPMLGLDIKMIMCLLGMIINTVIELANISMRNSCVERRNSFVVMFTMTVCYFGIFVVYKIEEYSVPCSDLIPIIFTLMSFEQLKRIFFKSIRIILLSRDVILFFILFIFAASIVSRVFFFNTPDYFDAEEPNIFTMNFKSFGNSFWSVINSIFLINNEMLLITALFTNWKFMVLFWMLVGLTRKLVLFNFLTAQLYNFYNAMFDKEVEFIKKNPALASAIKQDIALKRVDVKRIEATIQKLNTVGTLEKNIISLEDFYKVPSAENHSIAENPDNFTRRNRQMVSSVAYQIFIAFIQFICIVCLVTSMTFDATTGLMYSLIFVLNFVLLFDSYLCLDIRKFDFGQFVCYFDILTGAILTALLMVFFMVGEQTYTRQIQAQNPMLRKAIGLILMVKIGRLLKGLTINEQIKLVFEIFIKSLGFVVDVFGSIFVIILIYSTVGIAAFGGNVTSDITDIYRKKFDSEMDPYWMVLNFNDYWHSFLTLFCVMMGGWNGISTMNTLKSQQSHILINLFFISFYFLTNLCFLSILFGFLVDNVSAYLSKDFERKQAKVSAPNREPQLGESLIEGQEEQDVKLPPKSLNLSQGLDELVKGKSPLPRIEESEAEDR